MAEIDAKDVEILRLLEEDSRRPYSEIAQRVDLSPPTVSDRIDRLRNRGVIERMTIEINRDALDDWPAVLVRLEPDRGDPAELERDVVDIEFTESVTRTAEGTLYVRMRGPMSEIRTLLVDDIGLLASEIAEISMISSSRAVRSLPEDVEEADPRREPKAVAPTE